MISRLEAMTDEKLGELTVIRKGRKAGKDGAEGAGKEIESRKGSDENEVI